MTREIFYITTPCKRCGNIKRYKSNDLCPTCKAEANKRYKARKAKAQGRVYNPRGPIPPITPVITRRENLLKMMVNALLGFIAHGKNKTD